LPFSGVWAWTTTSANSKPANSTIFFIFSLIKPLAS
jgi:hypothetical protein